MIRLLDILISLFGLIFISPLFILLIIIGLLDTGKPFYFQERLGLDRKIFILIKFRSMHIETSSIATHLIDVNSVTKWGSYIRKLKLDELPQLINVLIGDMSMVGPRPNLCNQVDLIDKRIKYGVYSQKPGITGLAQIRKIDMSNPVLLAETDATMLKNFNICSYFKYIFLTISGKGFGDNSIR